MRNIPKCCTQICIYDRQLRSNFRTCTYLPTHTQTFKIPLYKTKTPRRKASKIFVTSRQYSPALYNSKHHCQRRSLGKQRCNVLICPSVRANGIVCARGAHANRVRVCSLMGKREQRVRARRKSNRCGQIRTLISEPRFR